MKWLVVVLALAACQRAPDRPFTETVRFAQADTLLAYSRAQAFVPVLGDSQRLMIGSYPTGRYGPRVQISPAEDSYRHTREQLRLGEYLLARIVNFDSLPYPKMNLAGFDTVYVWTLGVPATRDGAPNVLYYSTVTGTSLEVGMSYHPAVPMTQAAARFKWSDADELVCVACNFAEWCVTDQ